MSAAIYNVVIEQGATFRFPRFQFGTLLVDANSEPILDSDGNYQIDEPRDFTGCKFRIQLRLKQRTDADIVCTITSEDIDGGITGDANGNIEATIPDELTDKVIKNGYWDLKCYNPDQTEDRLVEGTVTARLAVTADDV